jgi:hypothetical protein
MEKRTDEDNEKAERKSVKRAAYGKKEKNVRREKYGNFIERFGTMNFILVLVAIALVVFSAIMLLEFERHEAIPDTLCTCVFGVLGGECGVMGWIKTTKERSKAREQELEDRKHQEEREVSEADVSERKLMEAEETEEAEEPQEGVKG